MTKLSPKRERFCQQYVIDLNGKQAAIRAGYSEKSAEVTASRLLSDVKVQARILELSQEKQERAGVDAAWLLNRLAVEAEADLADLYTEEGALKPVREWPKIWRQGLVAGLDVDEEFYTDPESGEKLLIGAVKKVRISDRVKRLELIGKHVTVGAFIERVEHTGKMEVNIEGRDADL